MDGVAVVLRQPPVAGFLQGRNQCLGIALARRHQTVLAIVDPEPAFPIRPDPVHNVALAGVVEDSTKAFFGIECFDSEHDRVERWIHMDATIILESKNHACRTILTFRWKHQGGAKDAAVATLRRRWTGKTGLPMFLINTVRVNG